MVPEHTSARRRTLFLSYLYPSSHGSGTQIRAASLVRMLAAREDVFLVVINREASLAGPEDSAMKEMCQDTLHVRTMLDSTTQPPSREREPVRMPIVECEASQVSKTLHAYVAKHQIDGIFIFRIETYFLAQLTLEQLPRRFMDLDELTFRRSERIEDLKDMNGHRGRDMVRRRAIAVTRLLEAKVVSRFEKVFVSSKVEAAHGRELAPDTIFHVLPNVVPSRALAWNLSARKSQEILFVGTLSYYPNEDAVRFFCCEILPIIRQRLGDAVRLRVIGFDCPPELRSFASEGGIELLGYEKDLAVAYGTASLVVVPLRAGTGTRLKILEAFAHGCPVVSTTMGAEGLNIVPDVHFLLADDPEAFANACVRILTNPALAMELVREANELQRRSYSLENLIRCYDEVLGHTSAEC